MARDTRSVIDVGMELIGMQALTADAETPAEEATEAEVLGALVAQVQTMIDRLAIDDRLARLEAMLVQQAETIDRLTQVVLLPRRRVPVRDEAGIITEVMDVVALPEGPDVPR